MTLSAYTIDKRIIESPVASAVVVKAMIQDAERAARRGHAQQARFDYRAADSIANAHEGGRDG